jgi:hypothetical protein
VGAASTYLADDLLVRGRSRMTTVDVLRALLLPLATRRMLTATGRVDWSDEGAPPDGRDFSM